MTFEFYPLRFCFLAQDSLYFPPGKSGNILRGAFGSIFRKIACVPECMGVGSCDLRAQCAYARIFEPSASGAGPSGLTDWPRPFVFRAAHLDGSTIAANEPFYFDLNVFEMRDPAIGYFVETFSHLVREGLGARRATARLESVWQLDELGGSSARIYDGSGLLMRDAVSVRLAKGGEKVSALRIDFLTPTELKSGREVAARPEFSALFARVRDRISTLRALYGAGPLDIDFKSMGERSEAVRMARCEVRQVEASRLSTRTGQTHSLGGFTGSADYEGELTEFVPLLRAAYWTGVGRQTVWGKGAIRTTILTR